MGIDELKSVLVADYAKMYAVQAKYDRYRDDPVKFGTDVFGDQYTDDVQRLMQSIVQNEITVAQSANATGKTHCAARIAAWFYKVFPGAQVYTAAAPPESNLKKLLWGEIGTILEKHKDVFAADNCINLHISRTAKEFISGVTIPVSGDSKVREAKFSGKHAPYLLFILDEGDAIPDEVYNGIESCMSGGHARLLIMFNPRSEMGAAYRMIRDHQANVVTLTAFAHPNVIKGKDLIPGAVTREKTVNRINMWTRRLSEKELKGTAKTRDVFELPKFLVGCSTKKYPTPLAAGFYKVMEPSFSYMVLGEYPSQGTRQLISREWYNAARARWDAYVAKNGEVPPIGVRPAMGLDVAEYGADTNVPCFRYGSFVARLDTTWGGVDTLVSAEKGAEEYKTHKAYTCCVDATGIGSSVAPVMVRMGCSAIPIKVGSSATKNCELGEFGLLRDQLWWECREWLRTDPGSMLPPDDFLEEELMCPEYWIDLKGKIKITDKDTIREKLKRSPDKADALCLTFAASKGLFRKRDTT